MVRVLLRLGITVVCEGLNLVSLGKILKCAGNDDTITLKARDEPDTISLMFESKHQDKIM